MKRLPVHLVLFLVIAGASSACAARASARSAHVQEATPAAPSARVRIADGDARPLELLLPITEHGRSRVEARAGSAFYRISVSHEGRPGSEAPLHFDIERTDSQGAGRRDVKLSVAVRMRRGARAVLARLSRPDGTTTTITATLQ